ncbi:MAG: hypothetical protein ACYDFR_04920, partial [Candidatus Omnitrophota bacterium]
SYVWLSDKSPFGKLQHIYDKKERLALEIEKGLDTYAQFEEILAKDLFLKLLKVKYEVYYLTVIKILTRKPDKFLSLIETMVFDKNLLSIFNIRHYYLQLLIKKYFTIQQNRLDEYVIMSKQVKYKNSKLTGYLKQDLLSSIPDNLRNEGINKILLELEKKLQSSSVIRKGFSFTTSWRGPKPDIELDDLKNKSNDELIKIMEDCTAKNREADPYDLAPSFEKLIQESPDKLPILLDKIDGRNIDQHFTGQMVKVFIEAKKEDPGIIFDIFWKLRKIDTWARKEFARFLNNEFREETTKNLNKELFGKIKAVLFDLAIDEDPKDDGTITSNNPQPQDAINRAINSVRGEIAEALVIFAHFFPQDKEIINKIKALSRDKTNSVKANLIYNLKFLIRKNYPLCRYIVNQFKNTEDPEIIFALVHYFSYLGPRKLKANEQFIKFLFSNPNNEIQKELGHLIGYRQIEGRFDVNQFTESIIKQRIGNEATRQALAFVLESQLSKLIESRKFNKNIKFYERLLDVQKESNFEVRERISFAFVRDEVKTRYFKVLNKSKIFNILLKDKLNIPAQGHLTDYLARCIFDNESLGDCIRLLHSQVIDVEGLLSDHVIAQKIASMLERIFESQHVKKSTLILSEQIFDKGLERGWEEFYNIFYKKYKKETMVVETRDTSRLF